MSWQGDRVRDRLAGRTLLLTGASGFLGKAVLATLLGNGYELKRLLVALRAPSGAAAAGRLRHEVLTAELFAGLDKTRLERDLAEGRLRALAADLAEGEIGGEGLTSIDTVIHCAASVSFEEPLDAAVGLNSLGPVRLLDRLRREGSRPHFVHVSTAYVADRQSGVVGEDGLAHQALPGLQAEALLAAGRRWREEVEEESRSARRAGAFATAARRDASRRPGLDAAERAEELRRRWVDQRLSALGRRRAQELGWPDTYALSKALGERLLLERSEHTTVIRPTIIESALRRPFPGWLEGIKVADPLILAYAARGLTHLPGQSANRIDIVPVDQVAHACVAAAAYPPQGRLRTIAIASSARNPLAIGELAEQIRAYFLDHPLLDRRGVPIEIGRLEFVKRSAAVARALRRQRLAQGLARLAIASPLPVPAERSLRGNRAAAERVARMVQIYGAYTELNCVFDDRNAQELQQRLAPPDREELSFDTTAIDWDVYLQQIHLPAVHRLAAGNPGERPPGGG